jgi:hypothetical protein
VTQTLLHPALNLTTAVVGDQAIALELELWISLGIARAAGFLGREYIDTKIARVSKPGECAVPRGRNCDMTSNDVSRTRRIAASQNANNPTNYSNRDKSAAQELEKLLILVKRGVMEPEREWVKRSIHCRSRNPMSLTGTKSGQTLLVIRFTFSP